MRNENNLTKEFIKANSSMDQNGCWLWKLDHTNTGYGTYRGKLCHRLSWEIFCGPIPENMCVCHTCDVRLCCNPDHLFIGTRRENLADMVGKDRGTGPTRKCKRVLSHDEVAEVILLKNSGWTYKQLQARFGLACGSLHEIVNGRADGPKGPDGRRQYRSLKDHIAIGKKYKTTNSKPEKLKRKKSSMYKGVTKTGPNKWIANYRGYLGSFRDEVAAAMAYDDAVIRAEGEAGTTNAKLGNYEKVFDSSLIPAEEAEEFLEDQQTKIEEMIEECTSDPDELIWDGNILTGDLLVAFLSNSRENPVLYFETNGSRKCITRAFYDKQENLVFVAEGGTFND